MIVCSSDVAVTKNNLLVTKVDEKLDETAKKQGVAWYMQSIVLQSADGNNQNFYGAATPENPKENDLWFPYNENGHAYDMLRFDGSNWISITDDLTNAQSYIDEAVKIAQKLDADRYSIDTLFSNSEQLWTKSNAQATEITTIKGDVNGLQSSVNNLNNGTASVITQLSDKINLRVSKGEVISQINLEADSATIKSKAIVLAGDTTVTGTFRVPSAQISGQLSASQISANKLSAISADLGDITGGTIRGVEILGSVFKSDSTMSEWRYGDMKLDPFELDMKYTMDNRRVWFSAANPGFNGSNGTGSRTFELSPNYSKTHAHIGNGSETYIGTRSTVKIVNETGIVNNYPINQYALAPLQASILQASAFDTTATNAYLRPSNGGVARVTATDTTDIFRPIQASAFDVSSSYTYKQDIEEMRRSALDIVDELKVYEYRMKIDVENGVLNDWKIGLIAEYSPQVAIEDNMKIDTYKMLSMNWKATQELNQKVKGQEMAIEMLMNELAELKAELEELKR